MCNQAVERFRDMAVGWYLWARWKGALYQVKGSSRRSFAIKTRAALTNVSIVVVYGVKKMELCLRLRYVDLLTCKWCINQKLCDISPSKVWNYFYLTQKKHINGSSGCCLGCTDGQSCKALTIFLSFSFKSDLKKFFSAE